MLKQLEKYDILISIERPIDFQGLGDSIFVHFDIATTAFQSNGNKGLLWVANMAGASAITIPQKNFGTGVLLICRSVPEQIDFMLQYSKRFVFPASTLLENYFRNPDIYLENGFVPK